MNNIEVPAIFKGVFDGCSNFESHGQVFKEIIDTVNPKEILEIGFFRGSSSFIWLHLSNANLTTFDPMVDVEIPLNPRKHDGEIKNVDKLKELFPNRFTFHKVDSRAAYPIILFNKYDLMFIDGSHFSEFVRSDLSLAITLKIPYILLDDFHSEVESVYENEFKNYFETIKIYNTGLLDTGKMNRACFAKLK